MHVWHRLSNNGELDEVRAMLLFQFFGDVPRRAKKLVGKLVRHLVEPAVVLRWDDERMARHFLAYIGEGNDMSFLMMRLARRDFAMRYLAKYAILHKEVISA